MQKINIIVNAIVPEPVGFEGKTGSVVRLVEILKKIRSGANEVSFTVRATPWMAKYFQESGVEAEFKIIPTRLKFSGYVGLYCKAFFLIVEALFVFGHPRTAKVDDKVIIYASSDLFWEVIPAFVYKLRDSKIEWVQVIHHIYPDWRKRPGSRLISFLGYFLQKFSLCLIRKKADKIILMNEPIRQELLRRGFAEKKMHVLSNGIDFDYFDKIAGSDTMYEGIFLGRLNASKGVADLLPIWKKVCEKFPQARLAIIGGSEESAKAEFIEQIKRIGLEKNIEVLGFLPDEQVFPLLKAGKTFVFPSHEEGWGIAIAQAMACGLPVVSWDLPVYQDVFENYTLQIDENDMDKMAENILKLLVDSNYRTEIGRKGQSFIKKYSWEEVAKKELEIIKL